MGPLAHSSVKQVLRFAIFCQMVSPVCDNRVVDGLAEDTSGFKCEVIVCASLWENACSEKAGKPKAGQR